MSAYRDNGNDDTDVVMRAVFEEFIPLYNSSLMEIPLESRPNSARLISQEISLFMYYAGFHKNGRNIFHFQPALTSLFLLTDVDEVILDAIKLPYDNFYISFGKQTDLNIWGHEYFVDGAYISKISTTIQIMLTTVRSDLDYKSKPHFVLFPDRYYYFPLNVSKACITVKVALDESIAEHQPFTSKDVPDTAGTQIINGEEVPIPSRGKQTQIEVTEENRAGFPVFLNALRLVVNGLCYLSSQHREVFTRFPQETPEGLLNKFQRAKTPNDVARVSRRLASMGYTKVHFCGDSIQQEFDSLPTGRELPTHWRRGHWRNQAIGQNYNDHKLIWIRPTVVRKDKGEPETGRIYDVSNPDE